MSYTVQLAFLATAELRAYFANRTGLEIELPQVYRSYKPT